MIRFRCDESTYDRGISETWALCVRSKVEHGLLVCLLHRRDPRAVTYSQCRFEHAAEGDPIDDVRVQAPRPVLFYSFCYNGWADAQTNTHCRVCSECVDVASYWHCWRRDRCRKDLTLPCEGCGGVSAAHEAGIREDKYAKKVDRREKSKKQTTEWKDMYGRRDYEKRKRQMRRWMKPNKAQQREIDEMDAAEDEYLLGLGGVEAE